jgi:apolipoprotein D and lipocalin family protein
MKRSVLMISTLSLLTALFGCWPQGRDDPPLETVSNVDLKRYSGTWFEIARYPNRFQKDCYASRAIYRLRDDGFVDVTNVCHEGSLEGPERSVQGKARVVDPVSNAKLEVSFFWPFWGDYWIIDLDPDYRWAVVGHPQRTYLWILARTPTLDRTILAEIRQRLTAQKYDVSRLIMTER